MRAAGFDGEVVVVDNGSTDGSPELAEAAGRPGDPRGASGATGAALKAGLRGRAR